MNTWWGEKSKEYGNKYGKKGIWKRGRKEGNVERMKESKEYGKKEMQKKRKERLVFRKRKVKGKNMERKKEGK